ncbi:kinesin-like protein subito [Condylostylus longicornis]|uniref:kinesin-like protein subito n=1 Tax=Condylostylus longicornis TaxID=2530218 RepID=UPI00244D9E73|nr:kinesin-like protein subito [Condylostylus longicornis]
MNEIKETRSFFVPRPPSIDRRFRPKPIRQVNLLNLIDECDGDTNYEETDESANSTYETSSETSSNKSESTESAFVYLRIKPVENTVQANYIVSGQTLTTNSVNIQNTIERNFTFSHIFDENVSQSDIYNNCIQDRIEAENNFTIMTYGTSGSGKTYTLLGTPDKPGIISRSLENIFTKYSQNLYSLPAALIRNGEIMISSDKDLKECTYLRKVFLDNKAEIKKDYEMIQQKIKQESHFEEHPRENESVLIYCSFIEIYNENVHDLLNPKENLNILNKEPSKKHSLKIIMNDGRVFVKNVTSVFVKNSFEAYQLLWKGLKRVTYASTAINNNSSRSHCIFMVDIIKFNAPDMFSCVSYKFCDLAGSERLGKTENKGARLKEAQQINKSLLVLGRCLESAYNNQSKKNSVIVPYRDSKLTMLLQTALRGKEKILLIVNIAPTEEYFEENINVLTFSSIARNIVYKPFVEKCKPVRFSLLTHANEQSYTNEELEKMQEEIFALRKENERLANLKDDFEKQLRKDLVTQFESEMEKRRIKWEEKIEHKENMLRKIYERKIEDLKNSYERKILRLQKQLEVSEEESSSDEEISPKKIKT